MTEENSSSQAGGAEIDFDDLASALLDHDNPLPPRYLYRLSDLQEEELNKLKGIWLEINAKRRLGLLEDLEELSESNSLVSFDAVCQLGLLDPDATARMVAVRALWECGEQSLIPAFLDLLENDQSRRVRAQAASGLGYFIYLGELEKVPDQSLTEIVEKLIGVMESDTDARIRRQALEALGFSSHPKVPNLIEEAYDYGDEDWLENALTAMGRSADERWNPLVVDKLDHANPMVRLAAARAAGELEIIDAEPNLLHLLDDEDAEVRMAAAWSLSQIGGDEARRALEILIEQSEDDEETDLLESALENLAFNEDLQDFNLFDLSKGDLEDFSDTPTIED